MKKKIIGLSSFVIAVTLIFSMFAAGVSAQTAESQYVYDQAQILTDSQYAELNSMAAEISNRYKCGVYFVTTDDPTVTYDNIQYYSEDLYLYNDIFGYGPERDGVMLVLSVYDRCYWLLAYGDNGNFAFTDYGKEWMSDNFVDNFSSDDWYGGLKDYITDCEYVLAQAQTGKPVDIYYSDSEDMGAEAYGIAFMIGLIIALVVCMIFRSQMKTANIAVRAGEYIAQQGIVMHQRHNRFLYSTVSRTRIQQNTHSSGGGGHRGGTSVSSRGFSGRGGRF